MGEDKWEHAEDKCEGGHEDRPKAQSAGLDRGSHVVLALLLLLFGKLHNQHGIFARKADEDDKSDLGDDVVVHSAKPHAHDSAKQAHRDDEDDDQGQAPTLVFSGVGQEYKEHAQGKYE